MAAFTPLTPADAERVADAFGLGRCAAFDAITAGCMNSNYRLDTDRGRYVVRLYERQGMDEIEAEWALLDHFVGAGASVPRRCPGAATWVGGRPVGVFEWVEGGERAADAIDAAGLARLGGVLGELHAIGDGIAFDRIDHYSPAALAARVERVERAGAPELAEAAEVARATLAELRAAWPAGLRVGVMHGDLFPVNVRWRGDEVAAVLDWEFAARAPVMFDVMVGVLAWCWRGGVDWARARAWIEGYAARAPIGAADRAGARAVGLWVALRFTLTRITDFHLRPEQRAAHAPDFGPFLDRLVALRAMTAAEVTDALFGRGV